VTNNARVAHLLLRQWLELGVENGHLDILVIQLPVGTDGLLVSTLVWSSRNSQPWQAAMRQSSREQQDP
jgi:hypothetical protein